MVYNAVNNNNYYALITKNMAIEPSTPSISSVRTIYQDYPSILNLIYVKWNKVGKKFHAWYAL